jgi:hypothetical protein
LELEGSVYRTAKTILLARIFRSREFLLNKDGLAIMVIVQAALSAIK